MRDSDVVRTERLWPRTRHESDQLAGERSDTESRHRPQELRGSKAAALDDLPAASDSQVYLTSPKMYESDLFLKKNRLKRLSCVR